MEFYGPITVPEASLSTGVPPTITADKTFYLNVTKEVCTQGTSPNICASLLGESDLSDIIILLFPLFNKLIL